MIDDITAKRIHTINDMLGRAIRKEASIGELGKLPIKGLTEKQSKYALDLVKKLQKEKQIETIHGSLSTRARTPDFTKHGGDALRLGDIYVNPINPSYNMFQRMFKRPKITEYQAK